MFPLLASAIEVSGPGGEMVKIGYPSLLFTALPILFTLLPFILIIFYFFYRKNLQHKQILAAIEKGADLSQLRPVKKTGPLWIKNLTAGITMLIIGIGFAAILWFRTLHRGFDVEGRTGFLVALILFAVGISRLIRGLLQRKAEKRVQSAEQNGAQAPDLKVEG